MAYTSITVEGGIFPADLLDQIAAGDAEGQAAKDFGIDGSRRLPDAIQGAFSDARAYWDAFQRRLARSKESRTTLTREDWVARFLELLGFEELVLQRSSIAVGNESYFISHLAGESPDAPPVHIVGVDQRLDHRDGARRSPHAVVQEYLNRTDALWGMVTNGERLRLLRDTARLAKPTYLEFDIEGMIEGNVYSEFVLLYRLLHASRFPRDGASPHECLLERYYNQGIEQGGRVREHLRDGVEEALKELGTAFLSHPESGALRARLENKSLTEKDYYRQLLRLVYRFLFLMVAEERRLIFPLSEAGTALQTVYTRYYGIGRLRDRAERYFAGDSHCDLWLGLRETFRLLRDNEAAKKLGLAALNGELFGPSACADLETACCTNEELLRVVRHLSTFVDEETGRRRGGSGQRRRVNYAALDVEEFGSVYESLLDFHPQVTLDPPEFALVTGSERKQTGSYYTPPELVRELIESALVPVMEERLKGKRTKEEKEEALLGMRVCDPASGSGHFLLAAARRIARDLARARGGEEEPPPEEYRRALRDVIRHCIYAVDKNPLAVDLCKVALWVEGHNAGRPLSFLDNHIKCGDSLVGVADLSVLEKGIPDDAYKPVTGDDKEAAKYYRNRNKREREGQFSLPVGAAPADEGRETLAREFDALAQQEEQTPGDVAAKEELYESLRGPGGKWYDLKVACDLRTYAFFAPLRHAGTDHIDHVPTTSDVRGYLLRPNAANGALVGEAVGFSQEMPFFHWPLEFPEVFARGGFDVVLGNPPYVASATLAEEQPQLRKFAAGVWKSAAGNWDMYVVFVELAAHLTKEGGRQAMVTPTRLLASDYCEEVQRILLARTIVSVRDFSELDMFKEVAVSVAIVTISNQRSGRETTAEFIKYGEGMKAVMRTSVSVEALRQLPPGYICFPLTADDPQLLVLVSNCPPLGSVALLSDGATTAEAYEIRKHVRNGAEDSVTNPDLLLLVNTGTVDPYKCLWGQEDIAYLGFRGRFPVVARSAIAEVAPRRLLQAEREKVIVAGMGRRIEAVVVPPAVLCGKSAVLILTKEEVCPFAIATVLNSRLGNALYKGLFGLRGVRQDWMSIGPRQLERLPIPPSGGALKPAPRDTLMSKEDLVPLQDAGDDELAELIFGKGLLSSLGLAIHALSSSMGAPVSWLNRAEGSTGVAALAIQVAERCVRISFGLPGD